MKKQKKLLLAILCILIIFSCKTKEISCPNGKVRNNDICECPKDKFEIEGECFQKEDNMFFRMENNCNCFEDDIILLAIDSNNVKNELIGRLWVTDSGNYPFSQEFTSNDMHFIKTDNSEYLFNSSPSIVYCNGNPLRYLWYLKIIDANTLSVKIRYFNNNENKPLDQDDCTVVFKRK